MVPPSHLQLPPVGRCRIEQNKLEMIPTRLFILVVILKLTCAQVTKKENVLLSRKKRYLAFPDGSNFVWTMVYVKVVMIDYPTRVHTLGECDVPFKLPSDARLFKRRRRIHHVQKRDIYSTLELALAEHGFNGTSCVKRILCEAKSLIPQKGTSMIRDMLAAVFSFDESEWEEDHNFKDFCAESVFQDCEMSVLDFIIQTLNGKGNK